MKKACIILCIFCFLPEYIEAAHDPRYQKNCFFPKKRKEILSSDSEQSENEKESSRVTFFRYAQVKYPEAQREASNGLGKRRTFEDQEFDSEVAVHQEQHRRKLATFQPERPRQVGAFFSSPRAAAFAALSYSGKVGGEQTKKPLKGILKKENSQKVSMMDDMCELEEMFSSTLHIGKDVPAPSSASIFVSDNTIAPTPSRPTAQNSSKVIRCLDDLFND
jgi:hypothetical protein